MKKSMAFSFVLEELFSLRPTVKPMFGCHAIYHHEKIVLITRSKTKHTNDNGVWLAPTPEHHASLKSEFPSLHSIGLLGNGETAWQNIPADADDFEESVLRACALTEKEIYGLVKYPRQKRRNLNYSD